MFILEKNWSQNFANVAIIVIIHPNQEIFKIVLSTIIILHKSCWELRSLNNEIIAK